MSRFGGRGHMLEQLKGELMAQVIWKDPENTLVQGVGESHRLIEWKRILPKTSMGKEHRERLDVQLVPEPTNAVDPTAVMMFVKGHHVGYLPRHIAATLFDQVKEITDRGDTLCVPGSIWSVLREDGLKANVSVYMPDEKLEDVESEYLLPPARSSVPNRTTTRPKLPYWGAGLAAMTLLGSGAGFSIFLFVVASLAVNIVWLIQARPPKLFPLISIVVTLLGFLIGIIVGVIKANA
jgi:hypothetical protein